MKRASVSKCGLRRCPFLDVGPRRHAGLHLRPIKHSASATEHIEPPIMISTSHLGPAVGAEVEPGRVGGRIQGAQGTVEGPGRGGALPRQLRRQAQLVRLAVVHGLAVVWQEMVLESRKPQRALMRWPNGRRSWQACAPVFLPTQQKSAPRLKTILPAIIPTTPP